MVWNFWYSSWLVYIVLEQPMSTGENSRLYFRSGLYIFRCTPGLCPWTYTFYPIYCSPQSRHRWAWCRTPSLCRWHTNLYISIRFWSFRNLGFIFDSDFNFKRQISQTYKICFFHIRDFRRIRKYLSPEAAKSVACALVTSHLDYCNSLLYNLPDRDIERLQRVQNCLARVVCKASRFSRSKPLLNFLYWLPVKYRIRFKLCTITFKAFLFH